MFRAHISKLDSSASCFIQSRTLDRGGKDRLKIRPMLDSLEGKSDKEVIKRLFGIT